MEHLYNNRACILDVRKCAQFGVTEYLINLALWLVDEFAATVFYALPPGKGVTSDFVYTRLDVGIMQTPRVAEMRREVDNVGLKVFGGGAIYVRGTFVPQGQPEKAPQLSAVPADAVLIDEYDRIPPSAVPLLKERLGDSRLAVERHVGTPTYPDVGIDQRYQNSTQWEPHVRCNHCSRFNRLDWKLVVNTGGEVPHQSCVLLCRSCRKPIDRLSMWEEGRVEWVAAYPDRPVHGYWFNKLLSPRISLDELWEHSQRQKPAEQQSFWNADVGEPHEPKGSRLSAAIIQACIGDFTMAGIGTNTAMGVDVQLDGLYYWIKTRGDHGKERTLAVGRVLEWSDLDVLMQRYDVARCVVDDRPELREDRKFVQRWKGRAFLGIEEPRELPGNALATWDFKKQSVRIDRTKALEEANAKVELRIDELPRDIEVPTDSAGNNVVYHLTANVKAQRVRDDGMLTYYFPSTGKRDDWHHAKAFCEVAMTILPSDDRRRRRRARTEDVPGTGEERYTSMRGRL